MLLCYPHIARTATKKNREKFDGEDVRKQADGDITTMFHSRTPEMFQALSQMFMHNWRKQGEKGVKAAKWFEKEYLSIHCSNWYVGSSLILGSSSDSNPIESSFNRWKGDYFGNGSGNKISLQDFLTKRIHVLLHRSGDEKGSKNPIQLLTTAPWNRNIVLLAKQLVAVEGEVQKRYKFALL